MLPFIAALVSGQSPNRAPVPASVPPLKAYVRFVTRMDGMLEIQTAAQRFVAEGKPTIWLVGAIHVGVRPYYMAIQRLLDYQDEVFYEGVRQSAKTPTVAKRVPDQSTTGAPVSVYTTFSRALGLDFQLNDIDYSKPSWTNVDLTMEDLNKLNAAESGGKPSQFDAVKSLLTPGSPMAKQFAAAMGMATPGMKEAIKLMMVKAAGEEVTSDLAPATERILLRARNKAVTDALAEALMEANQPQSIGIFYGAGHMPGLQNTLVTQYGYHLSEKRWFAAAHADPRKVDATGKVLLEAFDNMMDAKAHP